MNSEKLNLSNKQNMAGILLTLAIISALILSGSASAIDIGITDRSNSEPFENDYVNFRIFVNVVGAERIPVEYLVLYIGSDTCRFYPNGTEINGSLCNSVEIKKKDNVPFGFGYGILYGYGTNVSGHLNNASFGTGYGYNNSVEYELEYEITWKTPELDYATSYDVRLDAYAETGSQSYTYSKTETSFFNVQAWYSYGGGGGRFIPATEPENPKASHYWTSILKDDSTTMNIGNEKIAFTRISFNVDTNLHNVDIVVEKLLEVPENEASGTIYQYLRITKENLEDSDIETVMIRFKVSKAWLKQKDILAEDIMLLKYVKSWLKLQTRMLNSESDWVHYEAFAPSFSLFAIGTASVPKLPETTIPQTQPQPELPESEVIVETVEPTTTGEPMVESRILKIIIFTILGLALIIGSAVGFISYKKISKARELTHVEEYLQGQTQPTYGIPDLEKPQVGGVSRYPELENYIKKCMSLRITITQIRHNLINVGWPEHIVDKEIKRIL